MKKVEKREEEHPARHHTLSPRQGAPSQSAGLTQWVGGELPAVYLQGTFPKSSVLGFLGHWGSWAPMDLWVSQGFRSGAKESKASS